MHVIYSESKNQFKGFKFMKCAQLEMETYKFFYEKEVNVLVCI